MQQNPSMRVLKYLFLLGAVFVIGVLIMGKNNAYEYREKSLLITPADTAWKYLENPLYWKHWNQNISSVKKLQNNQYRVLFHTPEKETTMLRILDKKRDSLSVRYEMLSDHFTKTIEWKIIPKMALCSLIVVEKTTGNGFINNARYAFDVEEYDEATGKAYEKLRVFLNATK